MADARRTKVTLNLAVISIYGPHKGRHVPGEQDQNYFINQRDPEYKVKQVVTLG